MHHQIHSLSSGPFVENVKGEKAILGPNSSMWLNHVMYQACQHDTKSSFYHFLRQNFSLITLGIHLDLALVSLLKNINSLENDTLFGWQHMIELQSVNGPLAVKHSLGWLAHRTVLVSHSTTKKVYFLKIKVKCKARLCAIRKKLIIRLARFILVL